MRLFLWDIDRGCAITKTGSLLPVLFVGTMLSDIVHDDAFHDDGNMFDRITALLETIQRLGPAHQIDRIAGGGKHAMDAAGIQTVA